MVGGYQTTLEALGLGPRSDIGEKGNAQKSGGLFVTGKSRLLKPAGGAGRPGVEFCHCQVFLNLNMSVNV